MHIAQYPKISNLFSIGGISSNHQGNRVVNQGNLLVRNVPLNHGLIFNE